MGLVIMNNVDDGPAQLADLGYGCQILSIDGVNVTDLDSWANVTAPAAGSLVNVTYFLEGEVRSKEVFSGVALISVSNGLPAYDSGMRSGMLMASLNDTLITNENDLKEALGLTLPFQTVNVTVLQWDAGSEDYLVLAGLTQVTLDSRKAYLEDNGFDVPSDYQDVGFLGINSAYLGAGVLEPETILLAMTNPYRNVESAGDFVTASLRYIAFPFIGLSPIQSPLADLFETTGYLAWMSIGTVLDHRQLSLLDILAEPDGRSDQRPASGAARWRLSVQGRHGFRCGEAPQGTERGGKEPDRGPDLTGAFLPDTLPDPMAGHRAAVQLDLKNHAPQGAPLFILSLHSGHSSKSKALKLENTS